MTYDHVIPHFTECGFPTLEVMAEQFSDHAFKFSVSFMEGTRSGAKNKVIGRHYPASFTKSDKGAFQQILIHPSLEDPVRVVGVLIHELIHAQLPTDAGHGKEFREIALKVGLCGKMTATQETPELQEKIKGWVKIVGDYPHSSFDHPAKERKKQTTRMVKVACYSEGYECGNGNYKVRMSRSLIQKFGCPICPNCGNQMWLD